MDASGNFWVVWQAIDQDGDGYGIFARRFDSSGNAVGDEFQVNTTTEGHQTKPTIALDTDGELVVVAWQGPDADGLGIFGQRFDDAGLRVGDEWQLNVFTALDQVSPTIAMNAAGQFVVGWVSDHRSEFDLTDSEKSIFVRQFNEVAVPVSDEILVHSIQASYEAQEYPDIAMDGQGNYVVTWQSINQDGNTWGVFARQFLADNTPVQPIEFQVNQTVLSPQRHSSVVCDEMGNFVISWQSHKQDQSGPGVFARVYDAAGAVQTDELLVPTAEQGPQVLPVMAMAPNGDFGVFWVGHGGDHTEGVHAKLYDFYSVALVGDYNGDNVVNLSDYTVWRDNVGRLVAPYDLADGDGNGVIDEGDYAVWKSQLGSKLLAGDFNGDTAVNLVDYTVWRDSKGQHVTPRASADADGNGVIDAKDYAVWKSQFGTAVPAVDIAPSIVPLDEDDGTFAVSEGDTTAVWPLLDTGERHRKVGGHHHLSTTTVNASDDEMLLLLAIDTAHAGRDSSATKVTMAREIAFDADDEETLPFDDLLLDLLPQVQQRQFRGRAM